MGNFAAANIKVDDQALIVSNALTGINAVLGATERGEVGVSYLCRNWDEYTRQLGGLLAPSVSLFPQYCKRILDAGGIVRVARNMHYTDASDISTATGIKAIGDNAGARNFVGKVIYFEDATKTITLAGDYTDFLLPADTVNIELPNSGGTTADVVVSATLVGGNTVIVLTSFVGGSVTLGSTLEWAVTFTGTLTMQVKDYGDFANGKLWFRVAEAASGLVNGVDIFIGLDGYPSLDDELRDIDAGITTTIDLLLLTNSNRWVNFLSNSTNLTVIPKTYFTSGAFDVTTINAMDIIGDVSSNTGMHSFDDKTDFVRLSVPEYAENGLDNAIVDYCSARQDCIPFLRVPTGLTSSASINYRNATGLYSGGVAIDTWEAIMTMTDIKIKEEFSDTDIYIPSLPDILALATNKDNREGAWGSFSGIQNESGAGVIRNTFGVGVKNLGSTAKILDAKAVTAVGLIPVIDKQTRLFGLATMCWGNSTLQKSQDSKLQFAHVAELMVYIRRTVKPIIEENLFTPNDVQSWKRLYRTINLLLRTLVTQRALVSFNYIGDQNVDTIAGAVYNNQADIANGMYKFKVELSPTTKMEVIEATFTIVNNTIGVTV
jgi:hypothetical protein